MSRTGESRAWGLSVESQRHIGRADGCARRGVGSARLPGAACPQSGGQLLKIVSGGPIWGASGLEPDGVPALDAGGIGGSGPGGTFVDPAFT